MNKKQSGYRTDIDGLRAIAVLAVVIFHAFPNSLPGGFTGVDIFFVISGYLISGIIFNDLEAGKFSFAGFYERRIRRIFPALLVTLLLVLCAGYYYLLIDEFAELGKHVAGSSVFIQNIIFLNESGYFDKVSDLKPLLHLWSLAVEEQFYILFPPIVILAWRFKKHMPVIIATVILASFSANLLVSQSNIAATFFLTTYRCWELLVGSLLAFLNFSNRSGSKVEQTMSLIGFFMIIGGIAFINEGHSYPSWRAIFPVLGTALMIYGGPSAYINKHIISNKAFVWVGLISYPLYLFHWPIFSFIKILDCDENESLYKIIGIILSFLLATLTYYCIEKKVRHSKSRLVSIILVILFIIVGIFGVIIWKKAFMPRSSKMGCDAYVEAYDDVQYFLGCGTKGSKYGASSYIYESEGKSIKTLYLGDSHMEQCAPRILELCATSKTGERGYVFFIRGGLVPIPNVSGKSGVPYEQYIPKMLELSKRHDIDRIVVAANWVYYFVWAAHKHMYGSHKLSEIKGSENALASLELMLKEFTSNGKRVYIVNNIPTHDEFHPKKLIKRNINGLISLSPQIISVKTLRSLRSSKNQGIYSQGEIIDKIAEIANRVGARIIDPMSILSIDGNCKITNDGLPIYRDGYHLRAGFVRNHAIYLDETILP